MICDDDSRMTCEICSASLPAAAKKPRHKVIVDLTEDDDDAPPPPPPPPAAPPTASSSAAALATRGPPTASSSSSAVVTRGGDGGGGGRECPICFDKLGAEGGVQALGCMDTFCRICIATHVRRQLQIGERVTCPVCRYFVSRDEQVACGPGRELQDDSLDEDDEEDGESEDSSEDEDDEDNDDDDEEEEGEEEEDEDRDEGGRWDAPQMPHDYDAYLFRSGFFY